MTSLLDICSSIYSLVKSIGEAVWEFDNDCGLFEEARKLHQYLRRIEVLISEIRPHLNGVRAWGSLREIEGTLSSILFVLLDASGKGRLVRYLQADRTLRYFSAAGARLCRALASLEDEACGGDVHSCSPKQRGGCAGSTARSTHLPDEIQTELRVVRGLMQTARFELPAAHMDNLQRFRTSCDTLREHFEALMLSYNDMMAQTAQEPLLSKESFRVVIHELQAEAELQQQGLLRAQAALSHGRGAACGEHGPSRRPAQQAAVQVLAQQEQAQQCAKEQNYLRMMMDVVRASHLNADCEAPLDFLCPLTHQLMQEPVLLHETGHSYERKALEEWWASGHRFCPRTGLHLRRLNISPNHNLRSAIERWSLHSDMHLSFKPALDTLISQQQARQRGASLQPGQKDGARGPAAVEREHRRSPPSGVDGSQARGCCILSDNFQPSSCDSGEGLYDSASEALPSERQVGCSRPAGDIRLDAALSLADTDATARGRLHTRPALAINSETGSREVVGGVVNRSDSNALSDGTAHCTPCFDSSQHLSSSEQQDDLTFWSSGVRDYPLADFVGLRSAPTCPSADANTCSVAT